MNFKQLMLVSFAVAIMAVGASSTSAQWRQLSSNSASSETGRETFFVGESKGPVREVEFRVTGSALQIDRAQVSYANGQTKAIYLPRRIRNGGRSGAIDLAGDERKINAIQIWCRAVGNGRRATIKLFGRK